MPLSIFIDALPYSEMITNYSRWFSDIQIAELQPNIAYSSVLHWQLYCNKYPDDRLRFVDWQKVPEKRKSIRFFSAILRPFDIVKPLSFLNHKVLDRIVFKSSCFSNIPFKFRKDFSDQSQYLFWDYDIYSKEELFKDYFVVSQDEGHISFDDTIDKFYKAIDADNKNLFVCIGEIDHQGHLCARGEEYSRRIHKYMDRIHDCISKYLEKYPEEEVIITSDHGMSTIKSYVDLNLRKYFGRQSWKNYVAYQDSCIMCVWCEDKGKLNKISNYLKTKENIGHLLSEEERQYYKVTNRQFGNLIFILREGNCFKTSWFGCSIKRHPDGQGMHGFWPERGAKDQMASLVLINGKRKISNFYTYPDAHLVIREVMNND